MYLYADLTIFVVNNDQTGVSACLQKQALFTLQFPDNAFDKKGKHHNGSACMCYSFECRKVDDKKV